MAGQGELENALLQAETREKAAIQQVAELRIEMEMLKKQSMNSVLRAVKATQLDAETKASVAITVATTSERAALERVAELEVELQAKHQMQMEGVLKAVKRDATEAKLAEEKSEAKSQAAVVDAEVSELMARFAAVAKVRAAQQQVSELETLLAASEQKVQAAQQSIHNCKVEADRNTAAHQSAIAASGEREAAAQQHVAELQAELQAVKLGLQARKAAETERKRKAVAAASKVEAAEKQVVALEAQVLALTAQRQQSQPKVMKLKPQSASDQNQLARSVGASSSASCGPAPLYDVQQAVDLLRSRKW